VKPIAANLSWATSARMLPCESSTQASILARNSAITNDRATRGGRAPAASRSATNRATVLCEQPARAAAPRNERVRSKASKISIDSSADFIVGPSWGSSGRVSTAKRTTGGIPTGGCGRSRAGACRGPPTNSGHPQQNFGQRSDPWPPPVKTMAISGHFRGRLWSVFHGRQHSVNSVAWY